MDEDLRTIQRLMSPLARRQLAEGLVDANATPGQETGLRIVLRCVDGQAQDGVLHLEVNLTKRRVHRAHPACKTG